MPEKLSKARIKANKKWDSNNKERKQYLNNRSTSKRFIQSKAEPDDLRMLKELIEEKLGNL